MDHRRTKFDHLCARATEERIRPATALLDDCWRRETLSLARAQLLCVVFLAALVVSAHGRRLSSASCEGCAWVDSLRALEDAPRDVVDAVERASRRFRECGLAALLDRVTYENASSDAVNAYTASAMFCSSMSATDDATGEVLVMQRKSMAASHRILAHTEYLVRMARSCDPSASVFESAGEIDAVESLHAKFVEAHRVITSGSCYQDETRLTPPVLANTSIKTIAENAHIDAMTELAAYDLAYLEEAYMNETVATWIETLFVAYDSCRRGEAGNWAPLPKSALDSIRTHYSALEFLCTHSSIRTEVKSGVRTYAFLINAAYDALQTPDACSHATAILPGRWFVSNVFDGIMSELSLECGLSTVGLKFMDYYSRGQGSRMLSLQLEEISRYDVSLCDSMFRLNERAWIELIHGLEIIDASILGCRRGREDSTTAKRLAAVLTRTLRKSLEKGCFSIVAGDHVPVAMARATLTAMEPDVISSALKLDKLRIPDSKLVILSASVTTAFIALAVLLAWITYNCAARFFARRKRPGAYVRYEPEVLGDALGALRPPGSPERFRSVATRPGSRPAESVNRRYSFSAHDAQAGVQRAKSLDPNLHLS